MRITLAFLFIFVADLSIAQVDERVTTVDFVQILEDNKEEVSYYYRNNWKILREQAIEEGYIHSYEVLEAPRTEDAPPFDLMMITTYPNREQYDLREENFGKLIEARGGRRLLNDKQPGEFRVSVFTKEEVKHWKWAEH